MVDPVIPTEVTDVPSATLPPAVVSVGGAPSSFTYEGVDPVGYGFTELLLLDEAEFDQESRASDVRASDTIAYAGGAPTTEAVFDYVFADSGLEYPGATAGRPDLTAAELPVATAGDVLQVTQFPSADQIRGSAFGMRVDVAGLDADAAWVSVALDVSGIFHLYGANYGDRIQYVLLPECALTDRDDPTCLEGVPLPTQRHGDGRVTIAVPANGSTLGDIDGSFSVPINAHVTSASLAATLAASQGLAFTSGSGGTIIAAVSGANSQSGTFAATDLAPAGTWGVSEQSGAFTYSVPINVPPASIGGAPGVSLNYSSASADGRTPATNGQTSILGEGWAAPTSYIEQHFVTCDEDDNGAGLRDYCWQSPYVGAPGQAAYTISLNGATYDLVWDGGNRYRTSTEAGWRISLLEDADNDDDGGHYFLVQLPDGSRYYFGLGELGGASTNSVATVPVFSEDDGEPDCETTTSGDFCIQGYRWMLDLALDSSGNAQSYWYEKETNYYSVEGKTSQRTAYTRAIHLSDIKYGYQWTESTNTFDTHPEARVHFALVDRCVERALLVDTIAIDPDPSCPTLEEDNARSYPDVPID